MLQLPRGQNKIIFCADDFAISNGVSSAIEELASLGRISATSAIVTGEDWTGLGRRLSRLRGSIAIGLHLNFTMGRPLGFMRTLAPREAFPSIGQLVQRAILGRVDEEEIAQEVRRQIGRFVEVVGAPPDFVDGHQHVHILPSVRQGVLKAVKMDFREGNILLRDPGDRFAAILHRRVAFAKAAAVATLAHGFARACTRSGFIINKGFSGFSSFHLNSPYASELPRFFLDPGYRHLVMCHPGFPDAILASRDPVTERRREEFDAIKAASWLNDTIWKPDRTTGVIWAPSPERASAWALQ